MENVVSARRLRKSMLNNINDSNISMLDEISIGSRIKSKNNIKSNSKEKNGEFKINFKFKIMFKILISIIIIFISLVCKLLFPDIIQSNKYAKIISTEYINDYSKEDTLNFIENISNKIYTNNKFIIPDKLSNLVRTKYLELIKPKLLIFNLKSIFIEKTNQQENKINNEEKIESNIKNIEENGIGGGEPIEQKSDNLESELKEVNSSISIMQSDANEIISKNINIIKPVTGKITSLYGAREQIFDNVNPYHTGIDIANVLNTNIISATSGVVTKLEENNKYYGNSIEIEINGVIFKYAHLNSFNVKSGDKVNQGDVIGKMGSTGMSTGSHLHFEIRINARTVDPSLIISF